MRAEGAPSAEIIQSCMRLYNLGRATNGRADVDDPELARALRGALSEVALGPVAGRAGRLIANVLVDMFHVSADERAVVAQRNPSTSVEEIMLLLGELADRQPDQGATWMDHATIKDALRGLASVEEGRPARRVGPRLVTAAPAVASEQATVTPSRAQRGSGASVAIAEELMSVVRAALTHEPNGNKALSVANKVIARRPSSDRIIEAATSVGHTFSRKIWEAIDEAHQAPTSTARSGRTTVKRGDASWPEYCSAMAIFLTTEALEKSEHHLRGVARASGVQIYDFLYGVLKSLSDGGVMPTVLPGDEALLKTYGGGAAGAPTPGVVAALPGWSSLPVYVPSSQATTHDANCYYVAPPQFVAVAAPHPGPLATSPAGHLQAGVQPAQAHQPSARTLDARTCFKCGVPGHLQRYCPSDVRLHPDVRHVPDGRTPLRAPPALPLLQCDRCGREGHASNDCLDFGKARRNA
jgi:hypothetical protein